MDLRAWDCFMREKNGDRAEEERESERREARKKKRAKHALSEGPLSLR